ncbi:MAG TPA: PAS domain S-box protein, partial [Polyangiaceae bacterium]|nr:PAS domain S-box protein [Polyangiaceae bacterium]
MSERFRVEQESPAESMRRPDEHPWAPVLEKAFDACPHPLVILHRTDHTILEINQAMSRVTGFSRDQIVGRTLTDIELFKGKAEGQSIDDVLSFFENSVANHPVRLHAVAGNTIECLLSAAPFHANDEPYVVMSFEDSHDRLDVEKALEVTQQRLELAFEGSSTALWEWSLPDDTGFSIAYYESMLGYPEGSLARGLNQVRALIHPEDVEAAIQALREHVKGAATSWSEEFRVMTRAGRWIWVHASGRIVASSLDGKPTRLAGTLRDVTMSKQVEEALRLESDRFQSLVHNSFDIVLVVDARGLIKYVTPSTVQLLGYEADAIVGTNAFSYVHPDDTEFLIREFNQDVLTKTNKGIPSAFRAWKADGRVIQLEGLATNMLENPAISGVVIVARDVTERRQMEARILQAQKLESLGVLAGGVAHDFNNLLTSILGNTSLAAQTLGQDSSAQTLLDRVQTAARRAAELTRQLLTFSGHHSVQGHPVHLGELTHEIAELMRVSIGRNRTLDLAM